MRYLRLPLPTTLPAERALASCNERPINYDPDLWELEYLSYRYLEGVSNDYLFKRHEDIIRNLTRLVSRRRDVIPIMSYLGSWYWYKKEHQTRMEIIIRGFNPKVELPDYVPNNDEEDAPEHSKFPCNGDVLFRFGKIDELLPIRIGLASRHLLGIENDPRTDNELEKNSFMPGKFTKITTKNGTSIPVIGDVKYTISGNDYYDLCMSCGYNRNLFYDFKADACLVINKPEVFADKIYNAGKVILPNHEFFHNPIQYYDPYNRGKNEFYDPYMSKDFSYAYQMEYRFIWFSNRIYNASKYLYLDVGPIDDFGYIYRP